MALADISLLLIYAYLYARLYLFLRMLIHRDDSSYK